MPASLHPLGGAADCVCYSLAVTRFRPPIAALALVSAFCACLTFAAKSPPPLPVFVPDSDAKGAAPIEGDAWVSEGPHHAMVLKRLEDEDRQAYLERNVGLAADPFAGPPGEPARFISFLLAIENRGSDALLFNPLKAWLKSHNMVSTPIRMSDLSFDYRVAGAELPPAYLRVRSALLEMPVTVESGQAVSGLLVFRAVGPKTRRFTVDVDFVLPSGDAVRLSAAYRRLTKKEIKGQ